EYVVLGGVLWRFWRKRVALWYVHKSVTPTLRIAHALVDVVLTASRESFRLLSHKVRVMGHGIDTESFKPGIKEGSIEMRIVTSGRIAPAKHVIEMLSVLDELHEKGEKFRFTIIGSPSTKNDEAYLRALEREISKRPYSAKVELRGPVSQREMPALLNKEDLFINLSTTGSLDKAVLEALAVGVPVVTTNEAFRDLLSPFDLYVGNRSFSAVAEAIDKIMNRPDKAAVVATLRNKIVERHSLSKLIPALLNEIGS
ncbi:MAG TPA: glycosyltransferase family 4 protein, partial [Candidatus Paceibacterota bacterium]|nr:glycosyltransferase family 4 protein [Candidatus Paceibacterota bacterium]